jgi:SAM-dependent methyltransferase
MTIANQEQADHWNNSDDVGHWVTEQARYDSMLGPFADIILEGAQLATTDRVLDVGCGCGATTLAAARITTEGLAHGVDLSAPMLERARVDAARAGITNATFEQADVQVHDFDKDGFDVAISRFGIMFFNDPIGAFRNLRGATRSGGRLSFVCWRPMIDNQWMIVPGAALMEHVPPPELGPPGAPGMFAFAEPDYPRHVLESAGWQDITVTARDTSMLVGGRGTLDDGVEFLRSGSMGRTMLKDVDTDTEKRAIESVRVALAPFADEDGVRLGAAVWLVTAQA